MSTPTERRYRREARYSKQLRVTVQPGVHEAQVALQRERQVGEAEVEAERRPLHRLENVQVGHVSRNGRLSPNVR